MKKLLVIVCLFTSLTSFGQTKEETISWLKEKMTKYMPCVCAFGGECIIENIELTECYLIIETSNECYAPSGRLNTYKQRIFAPVIATMVVDPDYGSGKGRIAYKSECVEVKLTTSDNPYMKINEPSYSSVIDIVILKGEDNICERMTKAFHHLASFCVKEKETF